MGANFSSFQNDFCSPIQANSQALCTRSPSLTAVYLVNIFYIFLSQPSLYVPTRGHWKICESLASCLRVVSASHVRVVASNLRAFARNVRVFARYVRLFASTSFKLRVKICQWGFLAGIASQPGLSY